MNFYIVVEGEAEAKVYPSWISCVNASLTQVRGVADVINDNYYLISGGGYPQYFDMVSRAIEDVNNHAQYDRLVVAVDSEDNSFAQKFAEVDSFIQGKGCRVQHRVIVQNCCLETWGLGNKKIFHRNPSHADLKKYVNYFDVSVQDPEQLGPLKGEDLNRAQFAFKYLRLLLREKNPRLIYTKRNPMEIAAPYYFDRIRQRYQQDNQLQSLSTFLGAFI